MSDYSEARALLRRPFPPEAIDQIPKGGTKLDYVGHAQTTGRLLDADPEWTWEPVAFDEHGLPALARDGQGNPFGLWIRLTVCGVTRYGFGELPASKKADGVKEAIGDAIRNAAMRFGVALDLWAKGELAHVDVEISSEPSAIGSEDGASDSRTGAPTTSSPADQEPLPLVLSKADRARIRAAFMARIGDLGLDYETQVKPWLRRKYDLPEGEGWSALSDEQAHNLYEALIVPQGTKQEKEQASERFKTAILEHQEAAA